MFKDFKEGHVRVMAVHLGFDMGIRNLAFCLMRHTGPTTWDIVAWDNVDLLSGGISAQDARRCVACAGPAAWFHESTKELWCKGCATGIRRKKAAARIPAIPALPCGTSVKDLRALGVEKGWADKKTKKDELLRLAATHYLMPWKAPKATHPSLAGLRVAMDVWLDRMLPTFAQASLIRLENQPVMKGPTMKSVQIMLFTLLGHRLEREHGWKGSIEFVHAGVKTRGAEEAAGEDVGDAETTAETTEEPTTADEGKAYRARKKTAEAETEAALVGNTVWLPWFKGRSKKSDLADAFLMALRK
jgi:hypothetical protein